MFFRGKKNHQPDNLQTRYSVEWSSDDCDFCISRMAKNQLSTDWRLSCYLSYLFVLLHIRNGKEVPHFVSSSIIISRFWCKVWVPFLEKPINDTTEFVSFCRSTAQVFFANSRHSVTSLASPNTRHMRMDYPANHRKILEIFHKAKMIFYGNQGLEPCNFIHWLEEFHCSDVHNVFYSKINNSLLFILLIQIYKWCAKIALCDDFDSTLFHLVKTSFFPTYYHTTVYIYIHFIYTKLSPSGSFRGGSSSGLWHGGIQKNPTKPVVSQL